MKILKNINSVFGSVCYRIGKILIDPGDEWEGFRDVEAVILTHGHFDHIYGLNRVLELNPATKVFIAPEGVDMLTNDKKNMSRYHESPFVFRYPECIAAVGEGTYEIAGESVEILATPGHHPSSLTFAVNGYLFTGDAYIPGIPTVTNLPGGDKEAARASTARIMTIIENAGFSGSRLRVCPGHPPAD